MGVEDGKVKEEVKIKNTLPGKEIPGVNIEVDNILNTRVEWYINELFKKLGYLENEEMISIKKKILGSNENFDELFDRYNEVEQEFIKGKDSITGMKSQVGVILIKILCLSKNGKYELALKEVKSLGDYLDNIPGLDLDLDDLEDSIYDIVQRLHDDLNSKLKNKL